MLASSSTRAGQVELSVENRLGVDSNVFRSVRETEDGTHEISPMLTVRDARDPLAYRFEYRPTYRTFMRTSGIDGADHIARGSVDWDVTPVDSLRVSGSYYNGRQFLTDAVDLGTTTVFEVNDRERIRRSEASLYYGRALSPVLQLGVSFDFDDFDASGTSPRSVTDSRAYTGRISIMRSVTPRLQLGLSGSGRRREGRAVGPSRVSSRTDVWDVMGSLNYRLTPTIDFSAQAGPSLIRTQQVPAGAVVEVPCPPPDLGSVCIEPAPHDEELDLNYFASTVVTKRWLNGEANVSYVRSESRSGSVAVGSSISDVAILEARHRVGERWTVGGSIGWDRRDQVAKQQGPSGRFRTEAIRGSLSTDFAWTSQLHLRAQYRYVRQETVNNLVQTASSSRQIDIHLAFVGIRFSFEPISY